MYAKQRMRLESPGVLLVFELAEIVNVAQLAAGLLDVECVSDVAM